MAIASHRQLSRATRLARSPSWRALWPLGVLPLTSVVLALAMPLAAARWPEALIARALAPPCAVWTGPVLAAAAAVLVGLSARGSRVALVVLLGFACLDQGLFSLSYQRSYPRLRLEAAAKREPWPPHAGGRLT